MSDKPLRVSEQLVDWRRYEREASEARLQEFLGNEPPIITLPMAFPAKAYRIAIKCATQIYWSDGTVEEIPDDALAARS